MPLLRRGKTVLGSVLTALILTSVEAFLSVLCILISVPIFVNPDALAPDSVLTLFPGWTIYIWATGLALGGGLSLIGVALSEYRIERIGVLSLMTTVGAFSFALYPGLPGSFITLLTFTTFTAAMAARYWVLGRLIVIQQLRLQYVKEQRNERRD